MSISDTRILYLILHLVSIIVLNTFVYKRLQASGRSFPISTRIMIGLISATLSMCMAGTVEILRQNVCQSHNFTQIIGIYVIALVCFFFYLVLIYI